MSGRNSRARLVFEDDVELVIEVEPLQPVLTAALEQGVNLAHQCRSGSCASCICTVVEGETAVIEGRAQALLRSEFDAGMRLSCSLLAVGDVTLEFPYPSVLTAGPRPECIDGSVSSIRRLSSAVFELTIDLSRPLQFLAGQYVRLRVPGTDAWRSYSIASNPSTPSQIVTVIRERQGGQMGRYLSDGCRVGDAIDLEGSFGSFVLGKHDGPHVFLAGGTGLGPVMPMIDELRERPGRTPRTLLCFSVRHEHEMFFLDEIELRTLWMAQLEARVGVSRPQEDGAWRGSFGNPLDLLRDSDLSTDTIVYVCGSPDLVDAARQRCQHLGLSADNFHSEQYLPEVDE